MAVKSAAPQITLEWISEDGSGPVGDRETRTRIRKQAMKLAGQARKERGNWGKRSGTQPPSKKMALSLDQSVTAAAKSTDSSSDSEEFWSPTSTVSTEIITDVVLRRSLSPVSSMTQLMRSYGINILDFWSLMNQIHIGPVASQAFKQQPDQMVRLLQQKPSSFVFELPASGRPDTSVDCLNDALECLSIRAHELMDTTCRVSPEREIEAYGVALKSLQKAVYDPTVCSSADVLCAVEALSLFEILDRSDDAHHQEAWSEHVAGASRLIQVRGPTNFQTDFERTLLFSVASSIVCECLRTNQACFLEAKEWQPLFESIIVPDETFSFRSELSVSLFGLYIRMPGLFRQVSNVVCHQDTVTAKKLERVSQAVQEFLNELANWKFEFESKLLEVVLSSTEDALPEVLESRSTLLGSSLALSIIGSRLQGALNTAAATLLEDEVQIFVGDLERLSLELSLTNPWIGFFLSQKKVVTAESALSTSKRWRSATRSPRGVIENSAFEEWCRAIGRQTCCDTRVWVEESE